MEMEGTVRGMGLGTCGEWVASNLHRATLEKPAWLCTPEANGNPGLERGE